MSLFIGVRFKPLGKTYYYDPDGNEYSLKQKVIVPTERGVECGTIVTQKDIEQNTEELNKIIRMANEQDFVLLENNKLKETEAYDLFAEKVLQHKLDMKLSSVEYLFDGSKIIFHFTSENRVDFRDLVRELAAVYHTRIELRQIGVRDEAKVLGGIGACGRETCCSLFLEDFEPVSINMAKEQNISLNPSKISGTCGRLMCCLKYEHEKKSKSKCNNCPKKSKSIKPKEKFKKDTSNKDVSNKGE